MGREPLRGCARPAAEGKDMDFAELRLADHMPASSEVVFRFAGKANHHVGCYRNVGELLPEERNCVEVTPAGIFASHPA